MSEQSERCGDLAAARMGLSRLERLAEVQCGVLDQIRARLESLARAGDTTAFRRERRKAELALRQLTDSLASVLRLRAALPSPLDRAAFESEFRPLRTRLEKTLGEMSEAMSLEPVEREEMRESASAVAQEDDQAVWGQTQKEADGEAAQLRLVRDRVLADKEQTHRLEKEIQDLNHIMTDLSTLVHEQGEVVDSIEAHVENAKHNVDSGGRQLKKAEKYATQSYPLMGAAVGAAAAGGPVGIAAGSIAAAVGAALTGGVLGALGGKFWKRGQRED